MHFSNELFRWREFGIYFNTFIPFVKCTKIFDCLIFMTYILLYIVFRLLFKDYL